MVQSGNRVIAGQLGFLPASATPVLAPLIAWQILHAVAGVQQLARVNARLDRLQRGLDRLTIRHQARSVAQLVTAIDTLHELSEQFQVTGSYTNDMVVRLSLADRDVRATMAEQQFLVNRFKELSQQAKKEKGKKGALNANMLIKEEVSEFIVDAKILTTASRASLLTAQAWLSHDLEHCPHNVPGRLSALKSELKSA